MIKTLTRPISIIFFITFLGATLRFLFLDRIPNAIGGDELNYILTAKTIWLYGTDITRTWNPISILWFQYPPGPSQAELLYLLQTPLVGPLPFSLFAARMLPALFSTLSIPLLFFIGKKLFNEKVGLISAFFFAINPWSIYIGRTAYENPFAVFFFLAAWCVLFYTKSWKLLFSIPLFFAAFYSYIGTKLIFLPFVFLLIWYSYYVVQNKKYRNIFLIVFASCTALVFFFIYFLFFGSAENRAGEILLPNSSQLGIQVDVIRRTTIENPITQLYENKPILFIRILGEKLYKTFSFDYLFFQGDMFFTVSRHGLFYAIDLIFAITGFYFLYKKQRREGLFLTLLLVLSTFPQLFHTARIDNFSFHLILMYPILILIMSFGFWALLSRFKSNSIYVLCIGIYILFLGNFLQIYFFQTPLQGYFDFKLRTLSEYIQRTSQLKPVHLYTPGKANFEQKYAFYTNSFDKKNLTISDCPEKTTTLQKNEVVIIDSFCEFKFDTPHISLAQLKDGGETYRIYHDLLCSHETLSRYPEHITINDFTMSQLSNTRFCKAFIVKQ